MPCSSSRRTTRAGLPARCSPSTAASEVNERVLAHLQANHDRIFAELVEFAAISSVSTDPAHAADMLAAAQWVETTLASAGPFPVHTISTPGNPVVYGACLRAPV